MRSFLNINWTFPKLAEDFRKFSKTDPKKYFSTSRARFKPGHLI